MSEWSGLTHIRSTAQPETEMNGEEWSERPCGLPTQNDDVPDEHPGDAETKEEKQLNYYTSSENFE